MQIKADVKSCRFRGGGVVGAVSFHACDCLQVQQNIHVAVAEYAKLKQQLEKNNAVIKVLSHLKEVCQQWQRDEQRNCSELISGLFLVQLSFMMRQKSSTRH